MPSSSTPDMMYPQIMLGSKPRGKVTGGQYSPGEEWRLYSLFLYSIIMLCSVAVFPYNGYGYPSGHRMPPASSPYFPSGYGGMPPFYMPDLSSMPAAALGPSHSMDYMSDQFQGQYNTICVFVTDISTCTCNTLQKLVKC